MKLRLPEPIVDLMKAQMIRAAKDLVAHMAFTIDVSKEDAVRRVLGDMPSVSIEVVQCSDYEISCCVPVAMGSSDRDYELCRLPCVLNTGRCIAHQDVSAIPEFDTEAAVRLTRLEGLKDADMGPLWCEEESGKVYNRQQEHVGYYRDGRVELLRPSASTSADADDADCANAGDES
jgi:hypothetical protein